MNYSFYEIINLKGESYIFLGFDDWSNFGHGSESKVVSTYDERYHLDGTRCFDISGYQSFLPSKIKKITYIDQKKYKNIF